MKCFQLLAFAAAAALAFTASPPRLYAEDAAVVTATAPFDVEAVASKINAILDQDQFSNARWGIRLETLDGTVLFDRDGAKSCIPASNMKLFTTAAALDQLGAGFTYETHVDRVGGIDAAGVLKGDIVIVGGGDPSLGAWHPDVTNNAQRVFDGWIAELKKAGIRKIEGNIVGDGRIFTEEYISGGWDYYDLPYWYAAGSSGLAIEENAFRTAIKAGDKIGDPPTITTNPVTDYVTLINKVKTVAPDGPNDADILWRQTEGNTFRYGRTVALGKTINERGSIWDGALYTAFLFREALLRADIDVSGAAFNIRDYVGADTIDHATNRKVLASNTSPPLSDICATINGVSHNFMADMVLRTLGLKMKGEGGFDAGVKCVEEWLDKIGAPQADRFSMLDGSGLAMGDFVQPRQMTYILRYMRTKSAASEAFVNSLSSAGESGWIKERMKDTPLAGKVRAKTGYIGNVRSLSGYIQTGTGDPIVFAAFCNLYTCRSKVVDKATDQALIEVLEAMEVKTVE